MKNTKLLSPYRLGRIDLKNRIVMAPMTRSRAIGNIPNQLMAEYYEQRSSAGLIITEGTSPSPNGPGYSLIPGINSKAKVEGWKKITNAVHSKGGKIFVQLMHTGRISHSENMPENVIKAIGKDKVGLRLSPYGVASDMPSYPEIEDTYKYLAEKLNVIGILYIHIVDHSAMGSSEVSLEIKNAIRKRFEHTLIFCGGYTMERAENELEC